MASSRGPDTLYVSHAIKLQETVYTMHWPLLGVHELFFYDVPVHRKRVRLRHCLIYVTLCSLLNYKSLLIKIGFDIPWDPGGSITCALYAYLNGFKESATRETTRKF